MDGYPTTGRNPGKKILFKSTHSDASMRWPSITRPSAHRAGLFLFYPDDFTQHHPMPRWLTILYIALITACGKPVPATQEKTQTLEKNQPQKKPATAVRVAMPEAVQIAFLIDPKKLTTLKSRGTNSRVLKITAILWSAKSTGKNPAEITQEAVKTIGWGGTPAGELTVAAILRNLTIAEQLGATTPQDIAEMKRGQSPTVRHGTSTGDIVSVDHIIPVAAAPELSNVIANLELMPLRANQSKGDTIGPRQRSLARQLHSAGLFSDPVKIR